MRVVELYCGIGGVAAALGKSRPDAKVVGAFDISAPAIAVYRHNFPNHPAEVRLVDTLPAERLKRLEADLFWLSPPCQPHTRRGHRRDLADPRSATFLAALSLIAACRPPWVALENVAGFETSEAHDRLLEVLADAGYATPWEGILCPSELGWPNRRPRYYLLASTGKTRIRTGDWPSPQSENLQLLDLLDPFPEPGLEVSPGVAEGYAAVLDRVDPADPGAIASCFTASYGRSPIRAGSYLLQPDGGLRHLSPGEVLRLLGFPANFAFPPGISRRLAWRLAGNSLSLPAVQALLASIPGAR